MTERITSVTVRLPANDTKRHLAKRGPARPPGRLVSGLVGLLGLATLAAVVIHFADIRGFIEALGDAHPLWLLAAVALQLSTYVSVALGWNQVLKKDGNPRPTRLLLPLALTKLFADQALPSAGMGGNVLLVDRLCALGVERGVAVAALLVSMVGYYAVYAALALVMLLMLWMNNKAPPLLVGLVTSFLLVAIAIPSLALWLRRRGSRPLPERIEQLPLVSGLLHVAAEAPKRLVADRRLILRVAGLNGLVFLADAATLWVCLLAIGHQFSFAVAFVALISGSIATTLLPLPLGLGSFEASTTAMLSLLGVPLAAALAATLLLRGFTLWIPLVPGYLLTRGYYRRRRLKAA